MAKNVGPTQFERSLGAAMGRRPGLVVAVLGVVFAIFVGPGTVDYFSEYAGVVVEIRSEDIA